MLGGDFMSLRELNIALLSAIPENAQQEVYQYLSQNFCDNTSIAPKSAREIYDELADSRACCKRGEYQEFSLALDEICSKYGL